MRRWVGVLCIVCILGILFLPRSSAQSTSSGTIALIDGNRNVALYDVASATLTTLTNDAGRERVYLMPTWSTDGQLAFFGVSGEPDNTFSLGIFVRPEPLTSDRTYFSSTNTDTFTYAYWSPGECPDGACRDLAILYTTEDGLAVRNFRSYADTFKVDEVAVGAPFYWDWSPDGQQMLWARNGRSLEIYDVAEGTVTTEFDETQGFQRSVDWSPVDDRLLAGVLTDTGRTDLTIFDGEERIVLLESLPASVSFAWSPDASQVAYLEASLGQLGVIDVASNDVLARPAREVLMFMWSPLGDKIVYLTLAPEDNTDSAKTLAQEIPALQWHIYDVAADASTPLTRFIPTQEMVYYLQFFDQFTHSHSFWSPNGQYFVYAEVASDGREVVSLVDVTADDPDAIEISEGNIAFFSWQ